MSDEVETQPSEETTEPETYPASYVAELRQEAAANRVKAKQATKFRDAYRAAVLKEACGGILAEPLEWSDEFEGEDGMPDAEKITEAAEALATEKPHLARVRPGVPQGPQGDESDAVNLADMLRAGA